MKRQSLIPFLRVLLKCTKFQSEIEATKVYFSVVGETSSAESAENSFAQKHTTLMWLFLVDPTCEGRVQELVISEYGSNSKLRVCTFGKDKCSLKIFFTCRLHFVHWQTER